MWEAVGGGRLQSRCYRALVSQMPTSGRTQHCLQMVMLLHNACPANVEAEVCCCRQPSCLPVLGSATVPAAPPACLPF